MTKLLAIGMACLFACAAGPAYGQAEKKTPDPAQLELTAEVASTSAEGYPEALRITIKNTGDVAVYLPLLTGACSQDKGYKVQWFWTPFDSANGIGKGIASDCGMGGVPKLMDRVKHDWVRLQPGEYMTAAASLRYEIGRYADFKPGTIEYWVEYEPPEATAEQVRELRQSGYIIPTEKLKTDHEHFEIQ